ncbi:hypothetical protein WJX82_005925 [Trebouxia sp. C0006]
MHPEKIVMFKEMVGGHVGLTHLHLASDGLYNDYYNSGFASTPITGLPNFAALSPNSSTFAYNAQLEVLFKARAIIFQQAGTPYQCNGSATQEAVWWDCIGPLTQMLPLSTVPLVLEVVRS